MHVVQHRRALKGHTICGNRPRIDMKPRIWTDNITDVMISRPVKLLVPGGPADVTQNCDSDTGGGQGLNRSTQKVGGGLP